MENNQSPCRNCIYDYGCGNYKLCQKWRKWFHEEWILVKQFFGREEDERTISGKAVS